LNVETLAESARYGVALDRESAYERLAAKLAPPPSVTTQEPATRREPAPERSEPERAAPDRRTEERAAPRRAGKDEPGLVTEVVKSSAFKSFLRSAGTVLGREITRSILGTARRR